MPAILLKQSRGGLGASLGYAVMPYIIYGSSHGKCNLSLQHHIRILIVSAYLEDLGDKHVLMSSYMKQLYAFQGKVSDSDP